MNLQTLKQNNQYIADLDHIFSQELNRLLTVHKHDFDLNLKIKKTTYDFINKIIALK